MEVTEINMPKHLHHNTQNIINGVILGLGEPKIWINSLRRDRITDKHYSTQTPQQQYIDKIKIYFISNSKLPIKKRDVFCFVFNFL